MAYIKRKKLILADGIANSEIQIGQKDKSVNISVSETEVNIDKSLNVNGNVSVQTPTEDAHAVNLGYLNAELDKKLDTEDSGAHIIGEETETNIVAETTLNFTLDAGTGLYRTVDNAITIADWETYRQMPVAKFKVTFDGVEYICYAHDTEKQILTESGTVTGYYDWQYLGNPNSLGQYDYLGQNLPFCVSVDYEQNAGEWVVWSNSTAATHTVKIDFISGEYKKLGYEYDITPPIINSVRGKNSAIFGSGNTNAMGSVMSGFANDVRISGSSPSSINIFGSGNRIVTDKTVQNNLIAGEFNVIDGEINYSTLLGYGNIVKPEGSINFSLITGFKNTLNNKNYNTYPTGFSIFGGYQNTFNSGAQASVLFTVNTNYNATFIPNAAIFGGNHTIGTGAENETIQSVGVFGGAHNIQHSYAFVAGRYNQTDRIDQTVFGRASAPDATAVLKVGYGESTTETKNIFVVHEDGRATVGAAPTADLDVATKGYADSTFVQQVTTPNTVYGVTVNGQRNIPISTSATGYTIPYRDANGEFLAATPTTDSSVTPKSYVDSGLDTKVDKITNTNNTIRVYSVNTQNTQESIEANFGFPTENVASIPLRTAGTNTINVGTPTSNNNATNKAYVDGLNANNVKLTGKEEQSIAGNVVVQGNLTVNGTTTTNEAESLAVKDNLIITNSAGAALSNLSGLFIKTSNTAGYAIAYDPTTFTVILGEGTIDSNNEATVTAEERKAIVTRHDSNTFTEGNLISWGSNTENVIQDSGIAANTVATKTGANRPLELGFSGAGNVIQFSGYSAADSQVIYIQPDKNIVRWYFRAGPSAANARVAVGTANTDEDAVNRGFADGRYLQLTGGTMRGDITLGSIGTAIKEPGGQNIISTSSNTDNPTIVTFGNRNYPTTLYGLTISTWDPVNIWNTLNIRNEGENVYTIRINGEEVYHPGNKPTATDIGAVATVTTPAVVYGTNANTGAQGVIPYSANAVNAIVYRDSAGQFTSGTPTADTHVANKAYVDTEIDTLNTDISEQLALKLTTPKFSDTGGRYQMIGVYNNQEIITSPSDPAPNANTLAARGNSGELKVAPPSVGADAVNLEYLQANYTPTENLNNSHQHSMSTITLLGNEQVTGGVSDLYWALFPCARGNRFAWMPEECVTFEQSDDGISWTTLTVPEQQRNNFFTTSYANNHMLWGELGTQAGYNVNSQFRVTINDFPNGIEAGAERYFGQWTKTLIWVGTNGCSGLHFKMERSTIGDPENFTLVRENVPLSGWSGPNDISHESITFGGNSTRTYQTARVRFTFGITGLGTSTATNRPQILSMMAFSKSLWNAGNGGGLANNGDLYQWDYQKNALFPKAVFEDLDSGDAVRVYSPNNKPTANDIQAYPSRVIARIDAAGADLNDYYGWNDNGFGFYSVKNNVANNPSGTDGYLMLIPWDSSCCTNQLFFANDSGALNKRTLYMRQRYNSGSWTDWVKFYTSAVPPTAAEVGALPLSGGTMTGNILLTTESARIQTTDGQEVVYVQRNNDTQQDIVAVGDDDLTLLLRGSNVQVYGAQTVHSSIEVRDTGFVSAPYNVARGYRLGNNNIQALVFDDSSGRIQVGNSGIATDINAQNGEVYVNDGNTKQPVYSGFNIPAYGDVLDTRNESTTPMQYLGRGYGPMHVTELKLCIAVGLPSGNGDYATVTTAIPWNGPSGGEAYQIAVAAPQPNASQRRIYARFSQSDNVSTYGNWGSWYLMYSTVEGETGGGGGVSTMLVFDGEAELSSELEDGATYAELSLEQSHFNRTPKISEQFILFARYGYVKYDLICTVVSMASGSVTVEASCVRKITVFTTHNITVYADRQSQETTRFGFTVALRSSSAIMGNVSVLPTLATEIQGKAGVFNPTDTAGPGAGSLKYIPASGYYMPAVNKKHSVYGIAANAGTIYVLYYDESSTGTTVNYFALNSYTTVYVADAIN